MLKIYAYKIKLQSKNRYLFETTRKQIKINLAVYFSTSLILKDKIEKKLKKIKEKKYIHPVGKIIKLVNQLTWVSMLDM
jgi:hypothetical protein